MNATDATLSIHEYSTRDAELWKELYPLLQQHVSRWVFASSMPSSYRQGCILEDIVQQVIIRIHRYVHQVECKERPLVTSIRSYALAIARNVYEELKRQVYLLGQIDVEDSAEQGHFYRLDEVTQEKYIESLFNPLSVEDTHFPLQ